MFVKQQLQDDPELQGKAHEEASLLAEEPTAQARRKRRRRWILVGIIAGTLTLIAVIFILASTGELNALIYQPVDMADYWVDIPAGEFIMGSEEGTGDSFESPQHIVYLDTYRIGRYEITNRQYNQCIRAGECTGQIYEDDRKPVTNVTWYQAQNYCAWIGGRLPTEAEWEKAARGGLKIPGPNGEQDNPLPRRDYPWGNIDTDPDCSLLHYGTCGSEMAVVGSHPDSISPYGIHDMAGNVREWVNDWFSIDYYSNSPSSNPTGPSTGTYRVERGGSLFNDYRRLRVAFRTSDHPRDRYPIVGFRCAASPGK